jgi:spermidine synthase
VISRETLDTARIPGGGGELRLVRKGDEYLILLGTNSLMSSRRSGSEVALAELACARLAGRPRPRLLIGGLGMGFTLRAALAALPAGAELVVAELVPEVVAWARGPMAALHAGSLDDRRVRIVVDDVARLIGAAPRAWDAILLDVDNGPEGLTIAANDGLYARDGLAAARAALRPGGVAAFWSSHPDPRFVARLRRAGFAVEEHVARSGPGGRRGARHLIWLATAPARG